MKHRDRKAIDMLKKRIDSTGTTIRKEERKSKGKKEITKKKVKTYITIILKGHTTGRT
jgi:hypothetical protein